MSGILRSRVRVDKVCKHCQIVFSVANYRKDTAIYCSRKCMALDSRLQLISDCVECGTKCEKCGFDAYPQILGVHHKDHNKNNNSIDNLAVLCPNCHSMEHMKHVAH